MLATGDDVLLVCTGGPKPNRFEHWTHYWSKTRSGYQARNDYLAKLGSYGVDYYFCHGELWFKREKHLTMYLLMFDETN